MEEPEGIVLSAQLIRDEQVIDSVERTLHLIEETELPKEEVSEMRTLEDTINDFMTSIEEACKERKVTVVDKTKLFFDLAIKLLSFKAENKKISLEVPVKGEQEKTEEEKSDERTG